jgi:hypothetical protein
MPRKYEPRIIGLSCWRREDGCRNTFNYTVPKGMKLYGKGGADEIMETLAGREGWVIGHFDGQGNYACPDCNQTVYDPVYLNVRERAADDTSPLAPTDRLDRAHDAIGDAYASLNAPQVGSLDQGTPNHHDHTKRGFVPQ